MPFNWPSNTNAATEQHLQLQFEIQLLQVIAVHGRVFAHSGKWIQIRRYRYRYAVTAKATVEYSYQLWHVKWLFCLVIFVLECVVSFCFVGFFFVCRGLCLGPAVYDDTRWNVFSFLASALDALPSRRAPLPARIPSQAAFFISLNFRVEASWKGQMLPLHAAFYSGK